MSLWHQWWSALRLGLYGYIVRPRHLALIASGFVVACATVMVVLTIPAGIAQLAANTGRADVAVVLSTTAMDEVSGSIPINKVKLLEMLPGVAHASDGSALVAPQSVVQLKLQRRDGDKGTLLLRGITPVFWQVVGKRVHMLSGRRFKAGLFEIIVGQQAARQYLYLKPGQQFTHRFDTWTTTGIFSAGNSLWSNEAWTDLAAVQGAYNSAGSASTVWVRLTSPQAFGVFKQALTSNPRLSGLQVLHQKAFYASRVAFVHMFVNAAALIIAIVLGLMASLAINNAIALALAARRHELAVLRALGYRQLPLLAALVSEILLVAIVCMLLVAAGTALWLPSQSVASSTGTQSIQFTLAITPRVMALTLGYALVLGTISVLAPAWRTLSMPLAKTLAQD